MPNFLTQTLHPGLYALFLTLFTAYAPDHRCKVPQCEAFNQNDSKVMPDIFKHDWLQFAVPPEKSSSNYLGAQKKYDGCKMYDATMTDTNPLQLIENACVITGFKALKNR